MKTILCFGDSNTWGYDPAATAAAPFPIRHPHDVRWTGVVAQELGNGWRVIEEGQNGRTTVHDDNLAIARNGRTFLPACLESHKPIDVVVMMLGTNDLKNTFGVSPGEIATGASILAKIILQSDAGVNGKPPRLLLVCPPAIGDMSRAPDIAEKINDGQSRSQALPKRYEAVAAQLGCAYLNSQEVVVPSPIDGIHLEAGEHAKLGKAIAAAVLKMAGAGR
jgi:lysophospholipase L1-like esterase